MGYKDEFYCIQNMIGYTGDIHDFPTIYFLKRVAGGSFYGHITQKHELPGNVGRSYVEDTPDPHYTIDNVQINGLLRLVEKGTGFEHASRNRLKTLRDMTANDIAICAQAIWRYPDEKYISEISEGDLAQMNAQADVKAAITPGALVARKNQIAAVANARRRQARNGLFAAFDRLLQRANLARRARRR